MRFFLKNKPLLPEDGFLEDRIRYESIAYLFMTAASIAGALILTLLLRNSPQASAAFGWFLLHCLGACVYLLLFGLRKYRYRLFKNHYAALSPILPWLYAALWGGGWLMFFDPATPKLTMLLDALLIAVSLAFLLASIFSLSVSLICIVILILPLIVGGLFLANGALPIVSLGGIAHLLVRGALAIVLHYFLLKWLAQREHNRQLIQSLQIEKQKVEQASREKTRFLAAASHDLRQPIQALHLFQHLLQPLLTEPKQLELLDMIQESTGNIAALLDSLLDISKLDAGIVTPHIRIFGVHEVLDGIFQHYSPMADAQGVTFRYVKSSLSVRSDPQHLERILQNLVTNAIKYMGVEGRLLLGVKRANGHVRIIVADNGVGIPVAEQEKVFDEFYQIGNPERSRTKGLGLGLAIVKRLADLLQHPLTLHSATGKGCRFALSLPLAAAEFKALSAADRSVAPMDFRLEGQVLIVEDDAHVARALAMLAETWGAETVVAVDLDSAVKSVDLLRLKLILSDYQLLADASGLELILELRVLAGSDIPAVLLTGNTHPATLNMLALYNIPVLPKPVNPACLLETVKSGLRQTA